MTPLNRNMHANVQCALPCVSVHFHTIYTSIFDRGYLIYTSSLSYTHSHQQMYIDVNWSMHCHVHSYTLHDEQRTQYNAICDAVFCLFCKLELMTNSKGQQYELGMYLHIYAYMYLLLSKQLSQDRQLYKLAVPRDDEACMLILVPRLFRRVACQTRIFMRDCIAA